MQSHRVYVCQRSFDIYFLPSNKLTALPIHRQWRPFVKIMAKVCSAEGWGYCNYTGDMSHDSRNKAIHEFSTDPKKNILICGLKCGMY